MKNTWIVLALCAMTVACSKTETAAADPAKPAATPAAETKTVAVKNPWGSFKVGSFVAMKTTMAMEIAGKKNNTTTEMKMTLVDLSADKATVETEVTAMGQKSKTKAEMPLTAAATTTPTGTTPAVTPKTGTETITVAGKSLNCKWTEVEMETNGNKVTTKTWTSEEVPGFTVKSVSSTKGTTNMETTTEVVDFKAA